jgi:hypothetical protein
MENLIANAVIAGMGQEAGGLSCWAQIWDWGYWISFVIGVAGSIYLLIRKGPAPSL